MQRKSQPKFRPVLFIGIIALFGIVVLLQTHAAQTLNAFEPETGVLTIPATVQTNASASNGHVIQFGAGTHGARSQYEPADNTAYIGVSTSSKGTAIADFDTVAGITTHPAIFNDYTPADGDMQNQFTNNAQHPGVAPMVSWNLTMAGNVITNGSKDAYITSMANQAKTYGKPMFVRLDWEMNGGWYNNYDQKGGTTPAIFTASWQHAYTIFKAIAPNAAFVWCPNVGEFSDPSGMKTPNENWYPGDGYVDWIGVDAYPEYDSNPPNTVTKSYGLDWFATYAQSRKKPLMLAEWGMGAQNVALPDASTTFDVIFPWAVKYPATVKALLYFDFGTHHPLETHPIGAAAYRSYTQNNVRYLYDIVP